MNFADLAFALYDTHLDTIKLKFSLSSPRRFERILLEAYRWISNHFEDGDRIFLFGEPLPTFHFYYGLHLVKGFSRGAYQVRVLAAMIDAVSALFQYDICVCTDLGHQVGLIHKGNEAQIPLCVDIS